MVLPVTELDICHYHVRTGRRSASGQNLSLRLRASKRGHEFHCCCWKRPSTPRGKRLSSSELGRGQQGLAKLYVGGAERLAQARQPLISRLRRCGRRISPSSSISWWWSPGFRSGSRAARTIYRSYRSGVRGQSPEREHCRGFAPRSIPALSIEITG